MTFLLVVLCYCRWEKKAWMWRLSDTVIIAFLNSFSEDNLIVRPNDEIYLYINDEIYIIIHCMNIL